MDNFRSSECVEIAEFAFLECQTWFHIKWLIEISLYFHNVWRKLISRYFSIKCRMIVNKELTGLHSKSIHLRRRDISFWFLNFCKQILVKFDRNECLVLQFILKFFFSFLISSSVFLAVKIIQFFIGFAVMIFFRLRRCHPRQRTIICRDIEKS